MPSRADLHAANAHNQGSRILDICRDWQEEAWDWSEDCATVSKYYSGSIAESEDDQDALGLVDHSNYLVGRANLAQARDETLAAFTKPYRLAELRLLDYSKEAPPVEKRHQEQLATEKLDNFLREEDRVFMDEVSEMVDRHVMHGDSVMMFPPEGEGWRPFSAQILTDPDAPQNPNDDNFTRWAVYSDLQLGEALGAISEGAPGWNREAKRFLENLWRKRYDFVDRKDGGDVKTNTFDDAFDMLEHVSPEEWAAQGEIGNHLYEFVNTRIRCFYYYQKDFSDPAHGVPIDFYIIARVEPHARDEDDFFDGDPLLYSHKGAYSDVSRCMVDFVLDTNLGVVDRSWGTIKGLGHVNYNADRWTNLLISSMVNNAIDKNTPLIQVADAADIRMLEKFVKDGYRANSIIPAGADFLDKSKQGTSVDEALQMISFLQSSANQNAIGHLGQSQGQEGELRVNAASRQQYDARVSSNRGILFARKIRDLLAEMCRRIFEEIQSSSFVGQPQTQIADFKKALRKCDIKTEWFKPDNVKANYSKLIGDGDPSSARAIMAEVFQHLGVFPAETRSDLLREWFAVMTGDWRRAEQIFAVPEEASPDQVALAMDKAANMMVLGQPMPMTKEDVPESQIPTFLQISQQIVDRATQRGTFEDEKEIQGLMAIGQHTMLLIQSLEQRGQRDLAQRWSMEVQRISTEAAGPLKNFQRQQEAQQDPKLALEQQKLELAAVKEEREQQTFQHKVAKDTAQQAGKDRQQDFKELESTRRMMNDDERLRLEQLRSERDALEQQLKVLEAGDGD